MRLLIARRCISVFFGGILLAGVGCTPGGFLVTPVSVQRDLKEFVLTRGGWLAPKIAIIDIDGVMSNSRGMPLLSDGENQVSLLLEQLDKAANDKAVKAVILRINSPGGTVTASELMHGEITEFRRRTGKPVTAVMMDVAASGGYYVACACDEIVAHRSTVTGSIGVLVQLFDVTGTMAKLGVTPTVIRSGELKAGGNPFQRLSPGEKANFERIVASMYEQFVSVVDEGRPKLSEEEVRALADGRVFTAEDALEAGLIDRVGTLRDTVAALTSRLGARRAAVVAYRRPFGYVPNYYSRAAGRAVAGGDINLLRIDVAAPLSRRGPAFMYLWSP